MEMFALAWTYVGAEYGGSIPAILIRTPGTNAAAATVIDGYEMQRQGRGGEALGISLISGVTGGLFGLIVLVALTEPLAKVALLFTPMAYFALGILAISVIATLAEGMLIKGLITGVLGLMIAMVGTDPQSGVSRFTFGRPELLGGLLLHGLQPGPLLFAREPEFIYGLYGGLAVANLAQIPLGILIMTPCLWLVSRPKPYLLAGIYALVFSGVYSINQSLLDLWIVLGTGLLGYGLRYFGFPFLPLVLGVILGHMIESSYRRSLVLSRGDHMIFLQDPVSAGLLAAALLLVIGSVARNWYSARRQQDRLGRAGTD